MELEDIDKIKHYTKIAKKNTKLLNFMVNDIHDLIEGDPCKLSPSFAQFSPGLVIEECRDLLIYQLEAKKLEFKVKTNMDISIKINSDEFRYRRILLNLLLNAIKYTLAGSITVSLSMPTDSVLQTSVEDTGIGIKKEALSRIFEMGTNIETLSLHETNPQGIGIGLTLCKNLSLALGGDISVKSQVGKGTCFTFCVKNNIIQDTQSFKNSNERQTEYLGSLIRPNAVPNTLSSLREETKKFIKCNCPKALVTDDDPMNLMIVGNYIRSLGVEYEGAYNGKQALEKIESKLLSSCCPYYSIIFMDLNMPVMDGEEATKRIVKMMDSKKIPLTPIIAVTAAEVNPEMEESLLRIGFTDILQKPLSKSRFLLVAKKYCLS